MKYNCGTKRNLPGWSKPYFLTKIEITIRNKVNMNKTRKSSLQIFILSMALILLIVYAHEHKISLSFINGNPHEVADEKTSPSRDPYSENKASKPERKGMQSDRSYSRIIDLLKTSEPDRWTKAFKEGLNKASISDLWKILNDPGIIDQAQSKYIRSKVMFGCMPAIRELEGDGRTGDGRDTIISYTCGKLHDEAGASASTLAEQFLDLQNDMDFQSADFRLLGLDYDATGDLAAAQLSMINKHISQDNDPFGRQEGLHALWKMRSDEITPDWSSIAELSKFQQARLEEIISNDVACASIGGCTSESPWTISLCSSGLSISCPAWASYDQIVELNLSPHEMQIRKSVLDGLPKIM